MSLGLCQGPMHGAEGLLLGEVLGLLEGDLFDGAEAGGVGGAFDGLDGEVLTLLEGLRELLRQGLNLVRALFDRGLQVLDLELIDAALALRLFSDQVGLGLGLRVGDVLPLSLGPLDGLIELGGQGVVICLVGVIESLLLGDQLLALGPELLFGGDGGVQLALRLEAGLRVGVGLALARLLEVVAVLLGVAQARLLQRVIALFGGAGVLFLLGLPGGGARREAALEALLLLFKILLKGDRLVLILFDHRLQGVLCDLKAVELFELVRELSGLGLEILEARGLGG